MAIDLPQRYPTRLIIEIERSPSWRGFDILLDHRHKGVATASQLGISDGALDEGIHGVGPHGALMMAASAAQAAADRAREERDDLNRRLAAVTAERDHAAQEHAANIGTVRALLAEVTAERDRLRAMAGEVATGLAACINQLELFGGG